MTNEERMVDLEIRIARQDDLLESLNHLVYLQQKKLDELENLCSALARRLKDLQQAATAAPDNEKPPHY